MINFIVGWCRSDRGHPARFDGLPAEMMRRDRAGEFSIEQGFLAERISDRGRRLAGERSGRGVIVMAMSGRPDDPMSRCQRTRVKSDG
jgi:hypothetical protein